MTTIAINTIDAVNNGPKFFPNKNQGVKTAAANSPQKTETNPKKVDTTANSDENKKNPSDIEKETQLAVQKANEQSVLRDLKVTYSIDDKTKKVIAKIVDSKTEKVIRQIPPEDFLKLSANLTDIIKVEG